VRLQADRNLHTVTNAIRTVNGASTGGTDVPDLRKRGEEALEFGLLRLQVASCFFAPSLRRAGLCADKGRVVEAGLGAGDVLRDLFQFFRQTHSFRRMSTETVMSR